LEAGSVDCLVYGDVLEHLIDPWALLRRHAAWLRPGGTVLACVPNVQHWTLLVHLLQGKWEYQDQGLLDSTHLRFFTLDSLSPLCAGAGREIADVQPRPVTGPQFDEFLRLVGPLLPALGVDASRFAAQAGALQYVVRARRPGAAPPRALVLHTVILEELAC